MTSSCRRGPQGRHGQRGTNHAWANRGTKRARVAVVLIDAAPLGIGHPVTGAANAR